MIPQAELDRALARYKARKLGHESPAAPSESPAGDQDSEEPMDEHTRVAAAFYAANSAEPGTGEVHLTGDDYSEEPHR